MRGPKEEDRDSPILAGSKVGGRQPVSMDCAVSICTTAACCTAVVDFGGGLWQIQGLLYLSINQS